MLLSNLGPDVDDDPFMRVNHVFASVTSSLSAGPLKHVDTLETEVSEASDLALMPDGRFLVVSDEDRALSVVDKNGDIHTFALDGIKNGASGYEAVTYDPDNKKYFVFSEDKSKLYRFNAQLELEKKIEVGIDGSDNKGVEGMTWLPASASPTGRAALLLVKEAEPKQLALLEADGTGALIILPMSDGLKKAAKDFSGIAYDPTSGHVFIASQESTCLLEVALTKKGATLVAKQSLGKLDRIEGIAADKNGIYVLTENDGLIHRFAR